MKAVALSSPGNQAAVDDEIRWQLAELTDEERAALRKLPTLGSDSAGPLGQGLLARGILGSTIRELQTNIGTRRD